MLTLPGISQFIAMLTCLIPAAAAHADTAPVSRSETHDGHVQDQAFEHYTNIRLIGSAIHDRNASLMTDIALQLAEGERLLGRTHSSGITAAGLLQQAARLAFINQDQPTLARLTLAASQPDSTALAAQLQDLNKLNAASRDTESAPAVAIDDLDVESIVLLQALMNGINDADLLGDGHLLNIIQSELDSAAGLTKAQKAAVTKRILQVREDLPAESNPHSEAMARLYGTSRQHWVTRPQDWGRKGVILFPPKDEGNVHNWQDHDTGSSQPNKNVQVDNDVNTRFTYTLKNSCPKAVIVVRLPGNKTDQLSPGMQKTFVFSGRARNAVLYVYNTKKEYRLRPGNHNFWWMPEGRPGLNLNAF